MRILVAGISIVAVAIAAAMAPGRPVGPTIGDHAARECKRSDSALSSEGERIALGWAGEGDGDRYELRVRCSADWTYRFEQDQRRRGCLLAPRSERRSAYCADILDPTGFEHYRIVP